MARPRGRQCCVQLPPGHSCSCQCSSRPLGRSVPGLVLVVPAIEIIVENHDAPGCHSSHYAPEGSRFMDHQTCKTRCNSLCGQPEATPEGQTTELFTSIPALQGHSGLPRIISWLVFGGCWSGMKPWCSSKVKEGQEKRSFQFQLPQLGTSP